MTECDTIVIQEDHVVINKKECVTMNRKLVTSALAVLMLCPQMGVQASADSLFFDEEKVPENAAVVSAAEDEGILSADAQAIESVEAGKYAPAQAQILKASSNFSAIRVHWQMMDCDGYEIEIKVNGQWQHAAWAPAGNSNKLIKGLVKGKTYGFRVRAYNKVDGKKYFGKRSAVFRYRTKGYKQKIDGITYIDGIMIVNKTYSIPRSYNPGGLTATTQNAFNKMCRKAAKSGIYLYCVSGFRSYDTQKQLYDNYVWRDGREAADRYSARPGHSEHQTGLALDVNNASGWFDGTPEAKWLEDHCCEFGFILRYPRGKEHITGYKYESWHIRYVGKSLATKLTQKGLTLEEYYGITSKYKNG